MYIVSVLVEHPVDALDTHFDYLSDTFIALGVRVQIPFARQQIIGYVVATTETAATKNELEEKHGFKYRYIHKVIDEQPLVNEELQALSIQLSKLTLAPRIACLQAMLPVQLKPNSAKSVGIKYEQRVKVLDRNRICSTKKQQEALAYLATVPNPLIKEVPYSKALLNKLVEQQAICYVKTEAFRDPYALTGEEASTKVVLTNAQIQVVQGIVSKVDQYRTALLHGVTGSGKTEVYLQVASHVIDKGKTIIILVPEIALTPMMVKAFKQRFQSQVAILHSRLSMGERYDEYRRILQHKVKIVVGARSAIFAPLENIGAIIMDEEHDASYKQESKPKYHTLQIARMRAKYHNCSVILGSATPSLESFSRAQRGIYDYYCLPERINQKPLPSITVVDMAKEIRNKNYSLFSKVMKEKIQSTITEGKQVILLLNKRGYASYVRCLDCGEVVTCPHCDVSLTYHKATGKMKCHYCEYETDFVTTCPNCKGHHLRPVGSGTQKIEEVIESMFAGAKVIRYDVDSTTTKGSHQKLLAAFEKQEANILLGTQMIAKGLDFENVTFVGVLNADISLHIPDFRANERTFQLLCQVSGRAGRGSIEGSVMIQTYNPEHFVLSCVKEHDYLRFYKEEMKFRKMAKYPPFIHMVSILLEGVDEPLVEQTGIQIKVYLQNQLPNTTILGPANSVIYMLRNKYRKRILIKFVDGKKVHEVLQQMQNFYNKERKNKVTVSCDFNPYSQI